MILKPASIGVKISDYPTFSGRHDDWYSFKAKYCALTRIHGYRDVIDVFDLDFSTLSISEHHSKRDSDMSYDQRVRDTYAILEIRTADSTAASLVTRHARTQDGALAWRSLRDYYDQDGNKDVYEVRC